MGSGMPGIPGASHGLHPVVKRLTANAVHRRVVGLECHITSTKSSEVFPNLPMRSEEFFCCLLVGFGFCPES